MKKFKDLSTEEKTIARNVMFDRNINTAAHGILGFEVRKLKPTKENIEKFKKQFEVHTLCGCFSCVEIAKTFVLNSSQIKEEVIVESNHNVESAYYQEEDDIII